jgi:hypothetical protein
MFTPILFVMGKAGDTATFYAQMNVETDFGISLEYNTIQP